MRRFVSPSPDLDNLFAACVGGNLQEVLVAGNVNHIVRWLCVSLWTEEEVWAADGCCTSGRGFGWASDRAHDRLWPKVRTNISLLLFQMCFVRYQWIWKKELLVANQVAGGLWLSCIECETDCSWKIPWLDGWISVDYLSSSTLSVCSGKH
jgi:hypothetical protein